MRLDKFISQNSELSRTQIQAAIKAGLVKINDVIATKANMAISESDCIFVNDCHIEVRRPRYFMLHKPDGYVSANSDSNHPTVMDLIDEPFKSELQIVGRLDIDTTGLILLTDDGQWNHKITSPKHQHSKCYKVTTDYAIEDHSIDAFADGILLHNEIKKTRPAELTLIDSHNARLSIYEGKYHQVKRMFAAIGNHVVALHRERIGEIFLDPSLEPGQYRTLTHDEIFSFEKAQ